MLTTNVQTHTNGVANTAIGRAVNDATALTEAPVFEVGFTPRRVRIINLTTLAVNEWFEGMAQGSAVRTATTGALTLAATGGITVTDKGFSIPVALFPASATLTWEAIG